MIKRGFGIVFLFVIVSTTNTLLSQDDWERMANRADSLRRTGNYEPSLPLYQAVLKEIPTSQTDDQLKYHIRIGLSYFMLGRNEQAEYHYKVVLTRTDKNHRTIFRGHALNNLGLLFQNMGNLDKSKDYYQRAYDVYSSLHEDFLSDIARMNIGKVLHEQGSYKDALVYLTHSAKSFEKREDYAQLGEVYSTLGLIQETLGDLIKAKKLHRASIAYREKVGEPYDLASSYNNIGWIFKESGQLDSAKYYYARALKLMKGNGDRNLGIVYHNLASVYEHEENWKQSELYLSKALRVKLSIGDSSEVFISLTAMAHLMNAQNKLSQSLDYLEQSRHYAKSMDNKEDLKDFYTEWKVYFKQLNMPDSALYYFEKSSELERELFQEQYLKELALLQESFEADHREHVIGELGTENKHQKDTIEKKQESISRLTWISITTIAIIITLILILIIIRQRSKKKLLESHVRGIEEEKKRLSRELHDASGSDLRNLAGELMELVRISKGEIHDQLEKLHKKTESTMQEIVMISHDLHHPRIETSVFSVLIEDFIYDWLENKPYQFTEHLDSIGILDTFSIEAKSHIYRFVQETLINIDRHTNALDIVFSVQESDGIITISINDNGTESDKQQKIGIGHKNLHDRAKLMAGVFNFENNEKGSTTTLSIPISSNLA